MLSMGNIAKPVFSHEELLFSRILLVEDEPRVRAIITLQLAGLNLEIIEAENGRSAIAAMEASIFDLVLLDISLPDISGLEVLEWINANDLKSGVIIVSGDSDIDSAIFALRCGVLEFIRKSSEFPDIKLKVKNALYRLHLEASNVAMAGRLQQSERLHRLLVDHSPDLIYTVDNDGCFSFVNSRVELLGYGKNELIGSHFTSLLHEDDKEKALYAFSDYCNAGRNNNAGSLEIRLKCKDGNFRFFENSFVAAETFSADISSVSTSGNMIRSTPLDGIYAFARDITDRKLSEETIAFQAYHDLLTMLPNTRLFKDRLEMVVAHVKRHGGLIGVLFMDLDRFKNINDTYGHETGDELLQKVGSRLRLCIRVGDTLARTGGDEYAILLPDIARAEDASIIAQKILDSFSNPFEIAGHAIHLSASIGIAVLSGDGYGFESLMKNAEVAMYKVKAAGKNAYKQYLPEMSAAAVQRAKLESDLRNAVSGNQLYLHYQPQYSVSSKEIVGMEALVRWQHPLYGLISPTDFIGIAEEIGLIESITDWVLSEACGQLAAWRSIGFTKLRMSVNVSPREFESSDIARRVTDVLAENFLPPDALEIEITENILLLDAENVISKMQALRLLGVGISIDDFGTRYSSLNYLRRFPVSTLKIDQSFVRDLADEGSTSPIIEAIIGIAKGYGLEVLAEGVESSGQMKALNGFGCDTIQGYHFSRPLPADNAARILSSSAAERLKEVGEPISRLAKTAVASELFH